MDDNIQTTLLLLLTVLLVLLNGFFVATEFAIVKVRSTRIKELMDGGSVSAKHAYQAITQLDAYLSATQLGITLASLGLGWVGEPVVAHRLVEPALAFFNVEPAAIARHFQPLLLFFDIKPETVVSAIAFGLAFAFITFAHIVFGELAPKSLAIQRAESTALWVSLPMSVFYRLFKPFIIVLTSAANGVLRLFGFKPATESDLAHSEEELRMIITASGLDNGGTLRDTQTELLDNVFDFGHRLARQVMIHRTEILALDIADPLGENVRLAQEGGHTRYPVIQEDIDTVIGFAHTKDLFALYQRDPQGDLRTIVREILLVPESVRVDALLRQFQKKRQHFAILVDEYGGTAGMVSIVDLLEELVGDLPDEFEPTEEQWIIKIDENTWSVDGRLPVEDLAEALGGGELSCEEACDTAGGYVFWAFGRIPETGDVTETDQYRLRVLDMDGRRVSRLEITILPDVSNDEHEADGSVLVRGGQ